MNIPIVSAVFGWLESEDMDYGVIIACFGFIFIIFGLHYFGLSQYKVFGWLFALAPLWLPSMSFAIFYYKWMEYVGKAFYMKLGRVTYEVIMPQEVYKSPAAMESFLTQIFNKATPDNLMETYLDGKRPQVFSLEIVSKGGDVRFYLNVPEKKGSKMVVPALYSQYPGIELRKLEVDYTAEIAHDTKKFVMSFHHKKAKGNARPIKTYIDDKLDMLPKEEEKVDTLVQMIEYMGSIEPHEQIWVQYQVMAHRERSFKNGQLKSAPTWEGEVEAEINKVMERDPKTKAGPADLDGMPRLTPGERDLVEAMERNVSKSAFEVQMRWMYITDMDKINGDNFSGMLRSIAAWDMAGRNKLGPRWRTDFNYKFISDPFGKRLAALRKQELKEYKLRKLFPKTGAMGSCVMSSEELASLWHPVGTVAFTPTLNRVSSAKNQAPSNLPIQR